MTRTHYAPCNIMHDLGCCTISLSSRSNRNNNNKNTTNFHSYFTSETHHNLLLILQNADDYYGLCAYDSPASTELIDQIRGKNKNTLTSLLFFSTCFLLLCRVFCLDRFVGTYVMAVATAEADTAVMAVSKPFGLHMCCHRRRHCSLSYVRFAVAFVVSSGSVFNAQYVRTHIAHTHTEWM